MSAEVISVTMNKGGVGKTSFISNLVGAITKETDKKVLIIELEDQGNQSISFGLSPEHIEKTIYDSLIGDIPLKECAIKINDTLDIVPANSDMSFIEFQILPNLAKYSQPFHLLKKLIDEVVDDYDFIFIDSPPAMGLIVGNALVAANQIIIPFVPEMFAVNGLLRVNNEIINFRNDHNPKLKVAGVVGMMVDSRTTLHSGMLQQARVYCHENDIHMFETVIPRSIRFANSAVDGKPATWTDQSNHLVSSYYEILDELIERGVLHV